MRVAWLCRTISEERQLPFTHPRSHFPLPPPPRNGTGAITSPKNRLSLVPPSLSPSLSNVVRAVRLLNVYAYVPAFPARGYRSTVQYRFFRNAGHTQGEPGEKRVTVNRDALPSDNIIQFREPVAVTFRGNRS